MELFSGEVILLDVVDLHDRDRIVTFLDRERGQKRGVAKGARTRHSRFSGQLQQLAKVSLTWVEKGGRDLVRISSVESVSTARRLQSDLEGILLGCYLADHMLEFAQENEPSPHLFRLLDTTLEALAQGIDRSLATRYYECWMLRLSGIFPPPDECPRCGSRLGEEAALVGRGEALACTDCASQDSTRVRVPSGVLDFLRRIGRENLGQMSLAPPDRETLDRVEDLAGGVRRSFLQKELKSYRVMRETLAGGQAPGVGG